MSCSQIIELCYKVLTSLHTTCYVVDIDNMLDFSNKLSTLRLKHHKRDSYDISNRPPLPLPRDCDQSSTPKLESEEGSSDVQDEGSFNLIDLKSMESLFVETQVDSATSSESRFSTSSGPSLPGLEYETIELKEITTRRWSGDGHLLQKSFDEQPLYQVYNEVLTVLNTLCSL